MIKLLPLAAIGLWAVLGCSTSVSSSPSPAFAATTSSAQSPPPTAAYRWELRVQQALNDVNNPIRVEEFHQALEEGAFAIDSEMTAAERSTLCGQCRDESSNPGADRFSRTLIQFPELAHQRDQFHQSMIHWLAHDNNVRLMDWWMHHDPVASEDFNSLDSHRRSALHLVHSLAMVQLVLPVTHSWQWAVQDDQGQTPLHTLAARADADSALHMVVQELCERHRGWLTVGLKTWWEEFRNGNEFNLTDEIGRTPLHWAAISNSTHASEALSRCAQVDLNVTDNWGRSALHYASTHPDFMIGHALLARLTPMTGARLGQINSIDTFVNLLDREGNSALSIANFYHNDRGREFLALSGAREGVGLTTRQLEN